MKKQTKSNLSAALQSLGIIFLIFFATAFACKDDNRNRTNTSSGKTNTSSRQTITSGGACSTEEEFKAIITHEKTYLARNYEEKEVIFNSFETEGPMRYKNASDYMTVSDDAYRVTTSFDVITRGDEMKTNKVYRERYENAVIMFYPYGSQNRCQNFWERGASAKRDEITEEY